MRILNLFLPAYKSCVFNPPTELIHSQSFSFVTHLTPEAAMETPVEWISAVRDSRKRQEEMVYPLGDTVAWEHQEKGVQPVQRDSEGLGEEGSGGEEGAFLTDTAVG